MLRRAGLVRRSLRRAGGSGWTALGVRRPHRADLPAVLFGVDHLWQPQAMLTVVATALPLVVLLHRARHPLRLWR